MAAPVQQFTEDYAEFDAQSYLEIFELPTPSTPIGTLLLLNLKNYHHVYASGSIKGKTLLDIGTGPTIYSIISAAPHCDNIILSDVCPKNREILEQWKDGSLKYTFDRSFRRVLTLEGKSTAVAPGRVTRTRNKISGILHCDIRNEDPFSPNMLPPVDIVTSSFCLEAVVTSVASYEQCARNMVSKLKPGGHLVLFGSLGGSYYCVGSKRFRSFGMTSEGLKSAWKKVGIEIISWEEFTRPDVGVAFTDVMGCFSLIGRKLPVTL